MRRSTLFAIVLTISAGPGFSAQGDDPDWPCIQRKVPELSLGQIWIGPDLPEAAAAWANDPMIHALVQELAARRLPLPEAEQKISSFAAGLPEGELEQRMSMLVRGLFDYMNHERSQVISGIARYARGQRDMAAYLRREASEVDALRSKPDIDQLVLARRNERLIFQTRIFQERAQSLTYVCEVPTLVEQRLYALVRAIVEVLKRGSPG
ncbi:hypothetical protein MRS76_19660 [Rhizobiaceae bacterium n13]|uniref:Uncharacterized protein n=1 Tax=Ferirhizobium litorale TaxID=2927786 RepID=A0AAE3QEY7_9HYPH|nr:hypothetical protein [Fererhizobium litorale]MDI7864165.1 hypothetical protein [Fererhizobium litorale]MDI7923776.1 hypothetical protein [Fererhizobium litorale]